MKKWKRVDEWGKEGGRERSGGRRKKKD